MRKFKIGDKVKVCGKLETTIEKIESDVGVIIYWFKDEKGKLWNETETTIEKIE